MTERRGDAVFFVLVQEEGAAKAERVNLTEQVMSFEYIEDEKKADMCKLTVRNWDLENFDNPIWKQGNRLIVSWGYPGNMSEPRTCTIQKVTGFQELSIEAQGAEVQLNKQTKCRVFRSMTRAEVVKQIAREHGLDIPEINKPNRPQNPELSTCLAKLAIAKARAAALNSLVGPLSPDQEAELNRLTATIGIIGQLEDQCRQLRNVKPQSTVEDTEVREETITQARQTDAQFLRRLAEIEGYEFFADVDGLHFHQRQLGKPPRLAFTWYPEDGRGDILKVNVTNDVFAKPETKAGKVTAVSRDPKTKEDTKVEGSDSKTERDKTAPVMELVDGGQGSVHFKTSVASEDMRPTTQTNKKAAKREVDGVFRKGQARTVELDIDLVGNPRVIAKKIYEIRNISKRLSGLYYFKQVAHKLSGPYVTSCKAFSDGTQGYADDKAKSLGGSAGSSSTAILDACFAELQAAKLKQSKLIAFTVKNFPGGVIPAVHRDLVNATRAELEAAQKKCDLIQATQSKSKTNQGVTLDEVTIELDAVTIEEDGKPAVEYKNP